MDSRLENKTNLESHVWVLASNFRICRERTLKNTNYTQANSANATDDEIKNFSNCVAKHLKAVALFPSVLNWEKYACMSDKQWRLYLKSLF